MNFLKTIPAAGIISLSIFLSCVSFFHNSSADKYLKATPRQFNAGTVEEGKTIEVTTSIQNTWDKPVEITKVKAS